MKQTEMSKYLKIITAGTGILFLVLVVWFLPSVLKQMLAGQAGNAVYRGTCIFIWITAVPCLLCLVKFWGVCSRIGENRSFLQGKCRGAEEDEPLYPCRQCAVCSFSGSILYTGVVLLWNRIFIRHCFDLVYLYYTYRPVRCPVSFGL